MLTDVRKLTAYKPYVYLDRYPSRIPPGETPSTVEKFIVHIAIYLPLGSYKEHTVKVIPPKFPIQPIRGVDYYHNGSSKRIIDIELSNQSTNAPERLIFEEVEIELGDIQPFLETGVCVMVRRPGGAPDNGGSTTVNYGDADDDD